MRMSFGGSIWARPTVYMQVLEKSMIPILKIIDKYDLQT